TAVVVEPGTRRGFFAAAAAVLFGSSLAIGFTNLAVTHLMWLLGFARFMFPNILIEPPTRFKVGFPDSLSPGQVETKFIAQFGVWVVRYEYDGQPMIYAIKSVCTHLGCTPNWLEAEQKFKCPCHGSGFYKDAINFFLHLHPVSIKKQGIALSFTWCMGGVTFFLFLVETITGVLLMFYYRPTLEWAYNDILALRDVTSLGIMREIHRWGAHAMVI